MLRVTLFRSWILVGLLGAVHAGAMACALGLLPLPAGIAAAMALGASLAFHVRRHGLLAAADAVVEVRLGEGGRCKLGLRNGKQSTGVLLGSSFVSVPLIVLNVGCEDGFRAVVILPDGMDREDRRRLRVWLRHRSTVAGSAGL
jgi:hypothetical protein